MRCSSAAVSKREQARQSKSSSETRELEFPGDTYYLSADSMITYDPYFQYTPAAAAALETKSNFDSSDIVDIKTYPIIRI